MRKLLLTAIALMALTVSNAQVEVSTITSNVVKQEYFGILRDIKLTQYSDKEPELTIIQQDYSYQAITVIDGVGILKLTDETKKDLIDVLEVFLSKKRKLKDPQVMLESNDFKFLITGKYGSLTVGTHNGVATALVQRAPAKKLLQRLKSL